MKDFPKMCITCKHAGFADDDAECETLICFIDLVGMPVNDNHTCNEYKINKSVEADAALGMW